MPSKAVTFPTGKIALYFLHILFPIEHKTVWKAMTNSNKNVQLQ